MTSRLDNLEEVSLAAPDTPLHNNDNPLWFAARETVTTPSHSSINAPGNHDTSPLLLLPQDTGDTNLFGEKIYSPHSSKSANSKRPRVVLLLLSVILAVVAAVLLTVYFLVIKPHNHWHTTQAQPVSTGPTSAGSTGTSNGSTWGGNGSTVTTSDGSTFTYINPFGGYCEYCWRFALFVSYGRC